MVERPSITRKELNEDLKQLQEKLALFINITSGACGNEKIILFKKKAPELVRKAKELGERVFDLSPVSEDEATALGQKSQVVLDILFRCVYGVFIPSHFWKTPLGQVLEWIESLVPNTQVGLVEAAKILGKNETWVKRNHKYLGAYRQGTFLVYDREILERFRDEILQDHKRLNLESDYWETSLGQAVRKLNVERGESPDMVGVNYVLKQLPVERSREWLYQHAEEFGGTKNGKRWLFDKAVVDQKIKDSAADFNRN